MASTASDDGFHEIQLNGKQLVFLFMAVTVVSVVIFLCGVLVGRSARPDAATATSIADQLPVSVPAPDAVPAPAAETSSTPSATSREELTYPRRLATPTPEREQLSPTPPPASAPKPAPAAAAPVAKPTPATSAPPATPPNAPAVACEPAGPGFAIQLAALGRRDEADGIARRLTDKGYRAYVVAPDAGAPPVFRVRVGKFKDRREAESVASRLQKEEQFNPWIVR
jgi:cell division septation protein DedD